MPGDLQQCVSPDVERLTRRFYSRFKQERTRFLTCINGIALPADRDRYASLLLNRLMFLYFLQKKGFLDHDPDYLAHRLRMVRAYMDNASFYRSFLLPLFYEGLSTPERSPDSEQLLGMLPYPGSDLFAPHEIERHNPAIQIADEAFEQVFSFFDDYHWHLDERPLQHEDEMNPYILGYVFEQYINQQQVGAYYTKEDVTEYIARNTIIPALFTSVECAYPLAFRPGGPIWRLLQDQPDRYLYTAIREEVALPGETLREHQSRRAWYTDLRSRLEAGDLHSIDDLITYNLDICRFARDTIHAITEPELLHAFYGHLQQLTILDPTCGSGAFLIAALNILEPLYAACLDCMSAMIHGSHQPVDFLEALMQAQAHPTRRYFILKSIITHNLYGVDIMEEATEVCKLRLFLKLLTQIDCLEDIEPLSRIEHHIRSGNALVGFHRTPDSSKSFSLAGSLSDPPVQADQQRLLLDSLLAREYGIAPEQERAFEQWRADHKPFHWHIEFDEIIRKGGFSVIIGNPPYVEYDEKKFPYTVRNFTTLACFNLYPCVTERSHQLLSAQGRYGMILPLAAFATKNMIPLIEGFQSWFTCSWLSFYHFRPSMLFSGGKVASIPTVICLARADGSEQRFSTHLAKWSTERRALLFPSLTYCQITAPADPDNRHYYPKFGRPLENAIMQKLLQHTRIGAYLASTSEQNTMYYRSAGGLYWKVFINFAWPYATTSNKQCAFQERYDRDVFVALFNSSLFWWYYTVTFDTFNLKDYMISGFRFSYPEDAGLIDSLRFHCQRLMDDFRRHARHLKRGGTGSYTVYARKSKHIIDDIDRVLARHYGFTDEELKFIINYDLKYRMGQENGEEA